MAPAEDRSLAERVEQALTRWPGVTASPHRFGGREFRIGRRELGHLHEFPDGDRSADLPFPRRVRDALIAEGRAVRHHWLPESGWVSVPIRGAQDLPALLELFRLNYERPWLDRGRSGGAQGESGGA